MSVCVGGCTHAHAIPCVFARGKKCAAHYQGERNRLFIHAFAHTLNHTLPHRRGWNEKLPSHRILPDTFLLVLGGGGMRWGWGSETEENNDEENCSEKWWFISLRNERRPSELWFLYAQLVSLSDNRRKLLLLSGSTFFLSHGILWLWL
jgi:hypothetical protein